MGQTSEDHFSETRVSLNRLKDSGQMRRFRPLAFRKMEKAQCLFTSRIRTLPLAVSIVAFLLVLPASQAHADVFVSVNIRSSGAAGLRATSAARSRVYLDPRLLGLRGRRLLLGSRRLGAPAERWPSVDPRLLGICGWRLWMAWRLLGSACRLLWRGQLRIRLWRRRLRRRRVARRGLRLQQRRGELRRRPRDQRLRESHHR